MSGTMVDIKNASSIFGSKSGCGKNATTRKNSGKDEMKR